MNTDPSVHCARKVPSSESEPAGTTTGKTDSKSNPQVPNKVSGLGAARSSLK